MDQLNWLAVATVIGSFILSVANNLVVEFLKQFIPQLDETQKAKVIKSIKLAVRTLPYVGWGLLLGIFIASGFFTEMVTRTIDLTEGFLVGGAPNAPPERVEVPTGERKFTTAGIITIIVCGIGGGIVGYFKALSAEIKERKVPGPPPSSA
jgi:uncharacterized membrane protein YbjE (DUF340 family)